MTRYATMKPQILGTSEAGVIPLRIETGIYREYEKGSADMMVCSQSGIMSIGISDPLKKVARLKRSTVIPQTSVL